MKRIILLSIIIVAFIFFTRAYAQIALNNDWSAIDEITVVSEQGYAKALARHSPLGGWTNRPDRIPTQIVVVKNSLWLGPACERLFVVKEKIVGVHAGPAAKLCFSTFSTNGVSATDFNDDKRLKNNIEEYQKNSGWSPCWEKDLRLKNIVPPDALGRSDVACPPQPVQITDVMVEKYNIVISMISEIGKRIVITLNQELEPIQASVDGQRVFPKLNEGKVDGTNGIPSQPSTNELKGTNR